MYGNGDWKVDFGGNTFLVGLATARAAGTLERFLQLVEAGVAVSREEVEAELRNCAAGAVANYNGNEYNGYYPITGTDLMFGVRSIDVARLC